MKLIQRTIEHEGGYVNNPNDAGGETKYGISKRSFPEENIPNLTIARAIELYKKHFWAHPRLNLDEIARLSERVAWKIFDISVNAGQARAGILAQRALQWKYTMTIDGWIGAESLGAIERYLDEYGENALLIAIAREQAGHYVEIVLMNTSQIIFLRGWISRAFDIAVDWERFPVYDMPDVQIDNTDDNLPHDNWWQRLLSSLCKSITRRLA
jgi:lysozyme family protein